MTYEETKNKLKAETDGSLKPLEGKSVKSVASSIAYPGHVSSVEILFTDGTKVSFCPIHGGCSYCDLDGSGFGIDFSVIKGK